MNMLAIFFTSAILCAGIHQGSSVRDIDIVRYLEQNDPSLADCVSSKGFKVGISFKQYADVDGDGEDELIIVGSTCYSGTGGPDLYRVYKLFGRNKLKDISPPDPIPHFKGKPIFPKDGNWIVSLEFKNGYLIRTHSDSHYGNGTIKLYFKWVIDKFELIKVVKSSA